MTIDLADPDLYASTGGLTELRFLQERHPVYWNDLGDGAGFWALTRYADALKVYRSPRAFTSEQGIQVGQLTADRLPAAGKMLVLSDRGEHRRIKAVISRHLTPAALRALLPDVRGAARAAIGEFTDAGPFDFVTEVASRLTMAALGGLLGIDPEERGTVARWTETAFGSTTGPEAAVVSPAEVTTANTQLFVHFAGVLARRKKDPRPDLLSALANSRSAAGERLSDEEILFNVHLLLAGGHESTRQALTGCAVAFGEHPDQWRRLRADPSLVETAVEEVLRWSAPSLNVMRTATEDVEIDGTLVKEGQRVTIWNPIVNRDESAFPRAHTFDVGRTPNRHLTFGAGSHFCLGAWFAQQELRILIEELAVRVTRIEVTGGARRSRSNRTWGYDHLPARLLRYEGGHDAK
ncbi:cytochrome P450 [Nonomuraea sp. MG754425]|uniref:cytochrome P450 n=1 Tax=Nonomuraea sp. MG754425 TaxID=2570319 RepID=UPI001F38D4E1|nr:cytochrome P450 [Nonomuraea sp. MG754425]MCF6467965.1 cytochrome P450 [Nonomuraea sp. MG754425]